MPCYKPMLATPSCISQKTGKVQYRFREKLESAGQLAEVVQLEDGNFYPVKALPCGKCIGCRLDYSKEWAVRCSLELMDHDPSECYFVTLTYDDQHVPHHYYPLIPYDELDWDQKFGYIRSHVHDDDRKIDRWYELEKIDFTGLSVDLGVSLTLRPDDLQKFIKRVRRWQEYDYGKRIRFYACGEYGSRSARPHYHLIMYGLRLAGPDNDTWRTVRNGNTLWQCKELEKYWPFGNVVVGSVTFESCGYVARYMLKKKKGEYGEFYKTFNLVPEFTRMSLKPGIGEKYYDLNKYEIYKYDEIFIEIVIFLSNTGF